MASSGIRGGRVRSIRKAGGSRPYHLEFGSEMTSEAGSKRFEFSKEDETVPGGLPLICDFAGLTRIPKFIFERVKQNDFRGR